VIHGTHEREHNPKQDDRFRAGKRTTVPRFEAPMPRIAEHMPRLVGLCGPARVGKDTFAEAFSQVSRFRIARFSETIKDTARMWFGWGDAHIEGHLKEVVDEELGFSPREFMLRCGTDFAREMLHPDIWVRVFHRRNGASHLVIPDVRFENEANWIRKHHGILVHVQRAGFTPEVAQGHASEQGIERDPARDYVTPEFVNVPDVRLGALNFWQETFETTQE
jgi:hypothetical protein